MIMLFFNLGCNSAEEKKEPAVILPAKELKNVAYGTDNDQKLDIYRRVGMKIQKYLYLYTVAAGVAAIRLTLAM